MKELCGNQFKMLLFTKVSNYLNSKLPSSRYILLPLLYEAAKIRYSSLLLTFPTRLIQILLGSLKSGWTAEILGTFMKMIE